MYFLALAADFDGTIAHDGVVAEATCAALERLKKTGRRIILVTGREIGSLLQTFPQVTLFDRVVAENGALVYDPATQAETVVAPAPSAEFVTALTVAEVTPLSVGRCIVATWEPNELQVLETIKALGLDLHITFNKGAVMILPPGVNKASGLAAALKELDISALNVVAVGDAENDLAMLDACGCAAAVANALPAVKTMADVQLAGARGEGVVELAVLIESLDAHIVSAKHRGILLGTDRSENPVYLEPQSGSVLIAGSSGVGKSTLATALTERMVERGLGFCVFDPEGDYGELRHAVSAGDAKSPPSDEQVMQLLDEIRANVVINTHALSLADRPGYFARILPRILSLRAHSGLPHWILIDEAHHLIAAARADMRQVLPGDIPASIFITVHPDALASSALDKVGCVIAVGEDAPKTIVRFCETLGIEPPSALTPLDDDEILFWDRSSSLPPRPVKVVMPTQARNRHKRKYAEGELDDDLSFFFTGPEGALNLRAQNLIVFMQLAEGVDDRTWEHHRRAGDYSAWFRDVIKDDELAAEAMGAEQDQSLNSLSSRERIAEAISRRYTAPSRGTHNWRDSEPEPGLAPNR